MIGGDQDIHVAIPVEVSLPADTPAADALRYLTDAADRSGPNRGRLRDTLASGAAFAGGMSFDSTGELRSPVSPGR